MYNYNDVWANVWCGKNLLVGKLVFCEANTTDLKTIYSVDGLELPNPIYVNGMPESQIMLDGDYTVRYYEYIGNGQMVGDMAEDHWRLYKTELIKQPELITTMSNDGVGLTVSTIDTLKDLNGMEDGDVVGVVGYYTKEDCPLRYYVWHQSGNYADDGGVVIKSNNTTSGAWIMKIPYNYIDVRWYGDIPSNLSTGNSSNLGQRAKAASAANKYNKDLYFSAYSAGGALGFYMFDGSNTVSVNKDIICDKGVRFVVKHGTTGTSVVCHELFNCDKYLFVSEQGQTVGGYSLVADWINTGWFSSGTAVASGARVGYIVENLHASMSFSNAQIRIPKEVNQTLYFTDCEILECFKKITGPCSMTNMVIESGWFADNYTWGNLHLYNCRVELENCDTANTYIKLKNITGDYNYGDLGEQQINATVHTGGTLENCYGTITLTNESGTIELHNASVTINGLGVGKSINAVDSWITLPSDVTMNRLDLRRGSIAGGHTVTLTDDSLIENASLNVAINTTGSKLIVRNSEIYGQITTRNIELVNNQIYAVIDQSDYAGVITVLLSGNMFHGNGVHYVHASQVGSVVNGIWISNGSTYSDKHWIRLDRTNLKFQDIDHHYSYIANAEPYLDQWNGRNRPMTFKMYSGHWTRNQKGTGIFATTTIPFLFLNNRELTIYAVPRQNFWRMFTVGRGFLCRSGCIKAACNAGEIGIMESDYVDHKNGNVAPVFNWGCGTYNVQAVEMADGTYMAFEDYPDSTKVGCIQCVSRDADGIAEYKCSFEAEDAPHGEYSYGMPIGFFPSTNWNGAGNGQGGDASYGGSLYDKWVVYPATSYQIVIYVFVDKDYSTGSNPQNVFS